MWRPPDSVTNKAKVVFVCHRVWGSWHRDTVTETQSQRHNHRDTITETQSQRHNHTCCNKQGKGVVCKQGLCLACHRVWGSPHTFAFALLLFASKAFALTLRQTNNTFALFVFFVCHRLSLESLFFVWQRCCLQARPLP